jgi:L-seryl-tRNA(Ser) seleniumtransferase
MKVGKEEIMGALAAVEARFARRDYDQEVDMWSDWLQQVAKRIEAVPGITTKLVPRPPGNPHPYLTVTWDTAKIGLTADELHDLLMDGEPRMQTMASGEGNSFPLRVTNIREDQVPIAAERLYEVFRAAPGPKKITYAAPASSLAGRWDAELSFVSGSSKHTFHLATDGQNVNGTHYGRNARAEISGTIDGARIELKSQHRYQGSTLRYTFTGRVEGDRISGEVDLGEYGPARWTAKRHQTARG